MGLRFCASKTSSPTLVWRWREIGGRPCCRINLNKITKIRDCWWRNDDEGPWERRSKIQDWGGFGWVWLGWVAHTIGRVVLLVSTRSDFGQRLHPLLVALLLDFVWHQNSWVQHHQKPSLIHYSLVLLQASISTTAPRKTHMHTAQHWGAFVPLPSFPFGNLFAPALPVCCPC